MSNTEFKSGDLVRFTERNVTNKSHVHFARVFRVHQERIENLPWRKADCG